MDVATFNRVVFELLEAGIMEAFSHRGGLAFRLTELGRTTELPEESS
jgi:hypothetical protein